MRFAIFTHVEHQELEGRYFAYPPYIREMNLWLKILNSEFGIQNSELAVEVVAPLTARQGKLEEMAYEHSQITFTKIPSINLLSLGAAFTAIYKILLISLKILNAMRGADHLHLRCPGNIGLLACILQVFFPNKIKTAKYAGNWDPEAEQPWSYKLQRWILSNTFLTRNIQVLVYGEWPEQNKNIKSFFTASFSEKTLQRPRDKFFSAPYIFLFVGNLVPGKGLATALKMIFELQQRGIECSLEIYGEGPERYTLQAYVEEVRIKSIEFKGNRSLEELEEAYQRGHFVILPSKSEGWPKAVAEGMFFGCLPIVTPVSCVPWMLGKDKENGSMKMQRGILLKGSGMSTNDKVVRENNNQILELIEDRERMERMAKLAKRWSQQYTLERLEEGIKKVLTENIVRK